jgi:CHAD domain-containing protein
VHQLRVATRRAMAALHTFEALLPRRRAGKMRKQLKRIRRAAGPARDLDVLAARLKKNPSPHDADDSDKLRHFVARQRRRVQPAIEKIHAHLSEKRRFDRRVRALVARVRIRAVDVSPESRTFAAAAQEGMKPLSEQFFEAAAADLSQTDALHALRICGKQIRYAIEIFGGALGPDLRQKIYPLIAEMQEKLGKIIDHVTAARIYCEWLDQNHPDLADPRPLIDQEHQAIDEGRREFLAWWTADRAAELRRRLGEQFAEPAARQSG